MGRCHTTLLHVKLDVVLCCLNWSNFSSSIVGLMKSPVRKRVAPTQKKLHRTASSQDHKLSETIINRASSIFGSPSKTTQNRDRVPSSSLFRSPAKLGLDMTASSKSARESASHHHETIDKENTAEFTTAIHTNNRPKPIRPILTKQPQHQDPLQQQPPPSSPGHLYSPIRSVLGSTMSRKQPQSPGTKNTARPMPSPSPRPPSRIARSPAAHVPSQNTPVEMINDVFTTSDTVPQRNLTGHDNMIDMDGQEEEDDEEVADILLGYTKTPAPVPGKKAILTEPSSTNSVPSSEEPAFCCKLCTNRYATDRCKQTSSCTTYHTFQPAYFATTTSEVSFPPNSSCTGFIHYNFNAISPAFTITSTWRLQLRLRTEIRFA